MNTKTQTASKTAIVDVTSVFGLSDPIGRRREQCVTKLEHQKALIADPKFVVTTERHKGKGEARTAYTHTKKIKPWFRRSAIGPGIAFRVHFMQGKVGFVVKDMEALTAALDDVIAQIRAGDHDAAIAPKKTGKKNPTAVGSKSGKPSNVTQHPASNNKRKSA